MDEKDTLVIAGGQGVEAAAADASALGGGATHRLRLHRSVSSGRLGCA
jgi:hypothetical protein